MDSQDTFKTYFTNPNNPELLVNDIKQIPKSFSKKKSIIHSLKRKDNVF